MLANEKRADLPKRGNDLLLPPQQRQWHRNHTRPEHAVAIQLPKHREKCHRFPWRSRDLLGLQTDSVF
ncbi:MAG: hypothetical protein WBX77_12680, partial [Pseudolabrys sp.]